MTCFTSTPAAPFALTRQLPSILVKRRAGAADHRVRLAFVTHKGKAMTDAVDRARERMGRTIFAVWNKRDVDELARLMRKLADAMNGYSSGDSPNAS